MGYRRLGMRTPPLRMQMPITGKVLPSSFPLLRFPLSLWLLQPSFELALVTTARTTNRRTSTRPKSLRRTSLMTPDPPRPAYLLFTSPRPAEESHQRLDCTGLSATVVDSGPSKRSRSHTRTRVLEPAPAVTVIESSAPPILKDNDMASIEVDVEAGAGVRKWEYDQLAWGYRDETGGGGSGGEGVSDDDVALIADERKRARFGSGGIARRRGFGDDKRRPWSAGRACCFCFMMTHAHSTLLCCVY